MKRYIKNNEIKTRNQIVVKSQRTIKDKDGNDKVVGMNIYNPTEEMILADGWVEYIPEPKQRKKTPYEISQEIVLEQYNQRTDIPNQEALERMVVIYDWSKYIGKVLLQGQLCVYNDKVWRSRQEHTVLEVYPPSMDTASLYEVIEIIPTGEKDDPIPYTPPMEIFDGKYYSENGILYLCIRNSDTALTHELSSLVGLYVSIA